MGEAADRIVEEIDQARTELDRDLALFTREVRAETDWRIQLSRHPWLLLGCVTAAVVLITRLLKS